MGASSLLDGQKQRAEAEALPKPLQMSSSPPQLLAANSTTPANSMRCHDASQAGSGQDSDEWVNTINGSSIVPFPAIECSLADFAPGSTRHGDQSSVEMGIASLMWNQKQAFPLPLKKVPNAVLSVDMPFFNPQAITRPCRKLTPSEEELNDTLRKLGGVKGNSLLPTTNQLEKGVNGGWNGISSIQQAFDNEKLKKDLLDGSVPDFDPSPSQSPHGSSISAGSSPIKTPRTSHVGGTFTGMFYDQKLSGSWESRPQNSPPVRPTIYKPTQWHIDAPEFHPSSCSQLTIETSKNEHNRVQGSPEGTGQIDPYIPTHSEKRDVQECISTLPVGTTLAHSLNQTDFSQHSTVLGSAVARNGGARVNFGAVPVSQALSPNHLNQNSNIIRDWKPSSSFHNDNGLIHGLLRNSPNIDDFVEMKRRESILKRNLDETRARLDLSYKTAMGHINSRDAEISHLKRFIRSLGAKVPTDITGTDGSYFEKELGMMFRTVCCWSKRFYKFPTDTNVPHRLQDTISEVCEDAESERRLMNSEQTKYLVVIALAARFFNLRIFGQEFFDELGKHMRCEDILHIMEAAKRDSALDDKLYSVVQQVARNKASIFLEYIHPLMSRPTDRNHFDQTRKQFISVTQQAARMAIEISRRYDWHIHFKFFHLGDSFKSTQMVAVNSNTLGLDMSSGSEQVIYELQGAAIRLCILPHIHWTKPAIDGSNATHSITLYKANALLL